MRTRIKTLLVIFVVASVLLTCKKEKDNGIQQVAVDIYIYTTSPSFINLTAVGGWVYVTGGVRGILVYRKSSTEFMAYERNCTYQPSNTCSTVMVDNTNVIAIDTCCNSKFLIYDGSVTQNPATLPLKAYSTTFDGSVLHIYN